MSQPLCSLFTPTHDPSNLLDAYSSLCRQLYPKWEWVIVPNGPAIGNIPKELENDMRVKIVEYKDENRNIGALKRFACEHATGDIFCELDHDDMLVPSILDSVVKKVQEGAGFVFSDAAVFLPEKDNAAVAYSENSNWETYDFRIFGKELLASRAFPVTARSLCEVYYAPDHIRCWTREAYTQVGGHDPELKICDDHDLICRTYLAKVPFAHTGSCGYLYRNYRGNSVKAFQKEIIDKQKENRDKYLHDLIDEWCRREEHPMLNLSQDGALVAQNDSVHIAGEISQFGHIRANNMLQYVPQTMMVDLMNEIFRVLVPGGWVTIMVPSAAHASGYAPNIRSMWSTHTFDYFSNNSFAQSVPGLLARFQLVRCQLHYPSKWHEKAACPYVFADLCALKGQRQPGRVMI